jgi:S1-C subfamily serine protease
MLRLGGPHLHIGTDPSADIRIPLDTAPLPQPRHAVLERRGDTYEVVAEPGADVWVNGEKVDRLVLASGDVLEIGRDGAILRFRLYPAGTQPYKSLPEVFSDCIECARSEATMVRKAGSLAMRIPFDLATKTTRRFRFLIVAAVALLAATTLVQARRSLRLERELLAEVQRSRGMAELVERSMSSALGPDELGDLVDQLRTTSERVQALEERNDATARVIAGAGQATLFLQGSYQFVQPETGQPLRMILGPGGQPLRNPFGHPALGVEGDGPPLEVFVTGTGFVATPEGLVLTNRHVAIPWEFDEAAKNILASGFEASWSRFVGYVPGFEEPCDMRSIIASDRADLAVLECFGVEGDLPFAPLEGVPPAPGDPVLVMGYPLGLRALMARSDEGFVRALREEGVDDFFEQARRLAAAGFMAPLASRGIVGQVTSASVVYDAETTSGGSGGPVLTLEGRVIAINTAILPEFGGSNLGVPSAAAQALLDRAQGN